MTACDYPAAVARWADPLAQVLAEQHTEPRPSVAWMLGVIQRESHGDPSAISPTGYRGLGQAKTAALADYAGTVDGHLHPATLEQMSDPDYAVLQLRVACVVQSLAARYVRHWGFAQAAHESIWPWARVAYGWGIGHLHSCVDAWRADHPGRPGPTLADLEAAYPHAGEPHVHPWAAARAAVRGERCWRTWLEVHPVSEVEVSPEAVPCPFLPAWLAVWLAAAIS